MKRVYSTSIVLGIVAMGISAQDVVAQTAELSARETTLLGCYILHFGPGLPNSVRAEIPSTIALLETPEKFGRRKLIPSAHLEGSERPGSWRIKPDGSVRFAWSDGFSGILVDLALTPEGLTGTARTVHDVVGLESISSSVRAVRMPCPAHLSYLAIRCIQEVGCSWTQTLGLKHMEAYRALRPVRIGSPKGSRRSASWSPISF